MYARVAYSLPSLGVYPPCGAKLSQLPFFSAVWGFYGVPVVGYAVRIFSVGVAKPIADLTELLQ